MGLHRVLRDAEPCCDLLVGQSIGKKREYLALARSEIRAGSRISPRELVWDDRLVTLLGDKDEDRSESDSLACTTWNAGLARSAATSDARSFAEGATIAMRVICAQRD
ncbi:MAG: hypothetical protein M3Z18_06675 [Gemmatimonadota bacterium]|nr:hypothetical protein [Gemmatimonadota bacterium]